ncbi:MAG: ABC transporter ATP-binding protein [Deltaproteobacteria bacterium]|nr:ABC transporter ATP-binding protein [Deltaproteobacteria bacterium]MBW1818825.1 ABC transporter ATP-binding protein [Deltaproteobacteria bacterium]MBW2283338.1 ABC transporter ATP-binding protein [Deltaproteobacteria bacterium]
MSTAKNDPMIVADKLTRTYPMGSSEVVGLKDIDLKIGPGELVVIKGDSGSGKSTLLALLAGLDRPTGGSLIVDGQDLAGASAAQLNHYRRNVVGMVFQSFNLLPTLSVMENVCLPALLGGHPISKVRSEAGELLAWLDLSSRVRHYPGQLSGGEMQRTAIARSLINQPRIILADEPTGNLDSRNGGVVMDLLANLNRRSGRLVIIATHSRAADPHATRQVRLKDGKVTGDTT